MTLQDDDFTEISGIGKKTEEKLKEAGFKMYKDLENASIEQLTSVKGIFNTTAEKIKTYFKDRALSSKNESSVENNTKVLEGKSNLNLLRTITHKKVISSSNLDRYTKATVKDEIMVSEVKAKTPSSLKEKPEVKEEKEDLNHYQPKILDLAQVEEKLEDKEESEENNENEEKLIEEVSELPDYERLTSVLSEENGELSEERIESDDPEDIKGEYMGGSNCKKVDYNETEFNGDYTKLHDISRLLEKLESKNNKNISTVINEFISDDEKEPKLRPVEDEISKNKKSQGELLSDVEIENIINTAKEELKSQNYYVLSKKIKGIDLLAVKVVKAKNLINHVLIIPLKALNLRGSVIVSSETLKYVSADHLPKQAIILVQRKYLDGLINDLVKVPKIIYNNLCKEGSIFKFLRSFLKVNVKIEKSRTGSVLFFRDGLLQFKVFIEPVVICQDETHSSENSIAFPYYSEMNLHVINCNNLQSLTDYLEVKYKTVEKYNKTKDNDIVNYFKVKNQTFDRLRLLSVPFVLYSGIFLLLVIFQLFEAIRVFILLSYGLIALYFVIILYLYYNFYIERKKIIEKSKELYYKQKIDIDDYDIGFIKEELEFDFLKQFSFECIDYESDLKVSAALNATSSSDRSEKKTSVLTTEMNPLRSTKKSKYGIFLED